MPQLVTFSRKDDPHGTPCFGRLDGDAITDLTATFKGRFSSLSDAANAGALDTLFDASGPTRSTVTPALIASESASSFDSSEPELATRALAQVDAAYTQYTREVVDEPRPP